MANIPIVTARRLAPRQTASEGINTKVTCPVSKPMPFYSDGILQTHIFVVSIFNMNRLFTSKQLKTYCPYNLSFQTLHLSTYISSGHSCQRKTIMMLQGQNFQQQVQTAHQLTFNKYPTFGISEGLGWCRWEDNIKMDLQEVGCGGMDWIKLAHDRDRSRALVNAAMNLGFHKMGGNFLTCCKPVSFSRRTVLHGVRK